MITIGVRIHQDDYQKARRTLEKLYFKSATRNDWQEDYFNQTLFRKAKDFKRHYKKHITKHVANAYSCMAQETPTIEKYESEVEGILLTKFAPPNKELSSMQQCK